MHSLKMTATRNALLRVDTGVERRLLYLGAGDDVGASLGLFWHKCDSFYLVDPFYGTAINYDTIITRLAQGTAVYMEGMRLRVTSVEEGLWESALPGRRYSVVREGGAGEVKRLCFVCANSADWLTSTTSRYNVAINKDYAGINDDSDFPLCDVWGRLNEGGIFAQTMGSRDATNYASYRYLGFEPLLRVIADDGAQVGYADGLHLFRKTDNALRTDYEARQASLTRLERLLMGALSEFRFHDPDDDDDGPLDVKYGALTALMARTGTRNWTELQMLAEFWQWLRSLLPPADQTLHPLLVRELIAPLKLESWGSVKFPP